MATQTALIVREVGGRLQTVSNWPIPLPEPQQVQLRVTIAGINPHDQKARDIGLFIKDFLPAVLAHDVAGIVTAVGSNVTKFKVGDRVFTQSKLRGSLQKGLQQYAVADEDFASRIPEHTSDSKAAALPTNVAAALIALFDPSGLGIPAPWSEEAANFDHADASILIVGGGGNCGRLGAQLAILAGIGKIVVAGGDEKELVGYGATHVLDRHASTEVIVKKIRDVVGDDLVYAFDAINDPTGQHLAVSALSSSKEGTVACLRFSSGEFDKTKIIGVKAAGYKLNNVLGISHMKPDTAKPFWNRIEKYVQ